MHVSIFRIPLMFIPISDCFTPTNMTCYNFTVWPSKCNIRYYRVVILQTPPACSVTLAAKTKILTLILQNMLTYIADMSQLHLVDES